MDFHLMQWRSQTESDKEPPSSKLPRLLLDPHHHQQQRQKPSEFSALPLFASEPTSKPSNLSAYAPDSTATATRFPRMGGCFSLAQWQDLELQVLIFKHMLAGAPIPPELLHLLKKSLLNPPPYYLPPSLQHYPLYQQALMQSGYWGKAAMDPEPGRCRRTDGKKWRCARDVVAGQKYCERHVHRGRNRSRKPVEVPTPTAPGGGGGGGGTAAAGGGGVCKANTPIVALPLTAMTDGGTHFALSGPSPSIDLLQPDQRSSEAKFENQGWLRPHNEVPEDGKSGGQILRRFLDDWPRSLQKPDGTADDTSPVTSATGLSMSIAGNPSSDFSLKLSTGNGNYSGTQSTEEVNGDQERPQLNWPPGWGTNLVVPMGGPLAEALRSSTSRSSPTSVLRQLLCGSRSEASYVST